MKRLLTLLLVLAMALGLTACGAAKKGADDQQKAATPNEPQKVLRVAMECAYAPYNWTQPTDANGAVPISGSSDYANGYDVMMAKLIAEKLGYKLEIVRLKWESIIPAVQTGTVDVAICGQSTTPDRLEMVDFSDPYYYASIVVLVPTNGKYANAKSVADLKGANVTSQLNTIWDTVCVPQIPNVNAMPGQNDAPAMIAALTSGRVDLVVTDKPTALSAAAVNPSLKVLEFEGENGFKVSDGDINIGISMKKGSDDLRSKINSALADFTKDDFKSMMDKAIELQPLKSN